MTAEGDMREEELEGVNAKRMEEGKAPIRYSALKGAFAERDAERRQGWKSDREAEGKRRAQESGAYDAIDKEEAEWQENFRRGRERTPAPVPVPDYSNRQWVTETPPAPEPTPVTLDERAAKARQQRQVAQQSVEQARSQGKGTTYQQRMQSGTISGAEMARGVRDASRWVASTPEKARQTARRTNAWADSLRSDLRRSLGR
jgi:hypothetical protein